MGSRLRGAAALAATTVASALDRTGVIDRDRLTETLDLAWPRIVTGFAIMSKNTVDLAVIGIVLGAPAVAGIAFAFAYWQLAKFVSIGLAGGTVATNATGRRWWSNNRSSLPRHSCYRSSSGT